MRFLLDTQALIYYVDQDHLLGPAAHAAITEPNNDLLLSAASIWEIAIKVGIGKLKLGLPFKPWMAKAISDLGLATLPITVDYADAQAQSPGRFHPRCSRGALRDPLRQRCTPVARRLM